MKSEIMYKDYMDDTMKIANISTSTINKNTVLVVDNNGQTKRIKKWQIIKDW